MLKATETLTRYVGRGAALLDEANPGWENRINLSTLDLRHPTNCILGQLYGYFWTGYDLIRESESISNMNYELITNMNYAFDFGFDASENHPRNFLILDALWAEEVQDRLAEN